MANGIDSVWSNEANDSLLRKLWSAGLSSGEIAAEIGCGVTRNAVIGRVHRLKLPGRTQLPTTPRAPKPHAERRTRFAPKPRADEHQLVETANGPKVERSRVTAQGRVMTVFDAPRKAELPAESIIPLGQRCSLLELNDEKCHWLIGDPGEPDFFFCGGKSSAGTPYCGYHARVAYQPPAARRDRLPTRT